MGVSKATQVDLVANIIELDLGPSLTLEDITCFLLQISLILCHSVLVKHVSILPGYAVNMNLLQFFDRTLFVPVLDCSVLGVVMLQKSLQVTVGIDWTQLQMIEILFVLSSSRWSPHWSNFSALVLPVFPATSFRVNCWRITDLDPEPMRTIRPVMFFFNRSSSN